MFNRQEDTGLPHSSAASINGDLPPLSRTGSPSAAEKDILVSILLILLKLYERKKNHILQMHSLEVKEK